MKINFDIDCTLEEGRTFLGLPDVKSLQEPMMGETEDRMRASLDAMAPETLVKTWVSANLQGV
jgi:hypothetical protein